MHSHRPSGRRRTSAATVAAAIFAVLLATVSAPAASGADVDADDQNVVTLNPRDGAGNEIPITTGGVRSVSYNTTDYTLQPGEANRTGCNGFGNRTAWVRFVPGVRGRLSVTASAPYDVMLFSYFTTTKLGETAFDSESLRTDNCNNATTGHNETNMSVPGSAAQNANARLQPGQTVLLQSASWCSENTPGCAGGSGGPTTLSVDFIPDDADQDGTPDTLDDCPTTPGSSAYNGCPDSDGDGVRDIDDDCPTTKGAPGLRGCPDRDGDGIRDGDDACPEARGPAAFSGCPDDDGDGVPNRDDSCPTVAGAPENRGCLLDRDSDGVPDKDDACPEQRGINADGCPDRDSDGVRDRDDKCLDVPGIAANRGCPSNVDGDRVIDRDDKCPTVAGNGANGCPEDIGASFPYRFSLSGSRTQVQKLSVRAPIGSRVELRCKRVPCVRSAKRKRISFVTKKRTTSILRYLRVRRVAAGSRIEVRVTYPRALGNVRTYTFRRAGAPRIVDQCIEPNGRRTKCS